MKLFNTTKRWSSWWANRKIDWAKHYMNPGHPHRMMIVQVLEKIPWFSLFELGCGAGANLARIAKSMPGRQLGGSDINPEAIAFAKTMFTKCPLQVDPADNVILSDGFADVILSDMLMIYVSPFKIKRYLKEVARLGRNYVVLCELHSDSLWTRLVVKWKEGYNIFNWPKLLAREGFYDIQTYKIPKEAWPDSDLQQKHCYIIVARIPITY